MNAELFVKASRLKLRFPTKAGEVSVEDLWDLPLQHATKPSLDGIAIALHTALQSTPTISFVSKATPGNNLDKLRFDIVTSIIEVKVAEKAEAEERAARAEKKRKILEILDRKENQALEGMSSDDLRAQLANL